MNRREVLKRTVYLTGAALSLPLASSLLSGCEVEKAASVTDYQPQFFNPDELKQVAELVDLILPETDSPSASQVGVHQIIDNFVAQVYPEAEQKQFRKGMNTLLQKVKAEGATAIAQLESEGKDSELGKTYLEFKQQTIAYYLSTETIGKNHLNYLPVPGAYEACIDLTTVDGKAWAL